MFTLLFYSQRVALLFYNHINPKLSFLSHLHHPLHSAATKSYKSDLINIPQIFSFIILTSSMLLPKYRLSSILFFRLWQQSHKLFLPLPVLPMPTWSSIYCESFLPEEPFNCFPPWSEPCANSTASTLAPVAYACKWNLELPENCAFSYSEQIVLSIRMSPYWLSPYLNFKIQINIKIQMNLKTQVQWYFFFLLPFFFCPFGPYLWLWRFPG